MACALIALSDVARASDAPAASEAPPGPASASDRPASAASVPTAQGPSGTRVYAFRALLDGKPIGQHRFVVTTEGTRRTVTSEADFAVRFLGIAAYRYQHHADEQWSGECLVSLAATTNDDGKPASVQLRRDGDTDRVTTAAGTRSVEGCLMTYAYWNPALRTQTRLLNPQTGKVDQVHVERLRGGTVAVEGKEIQATVYRIVGGDSPIDVWYSDQGEWVGLDSTVSGKHQLSYRLP